MDLSNNQNKKDFERLIAPDIIKLFKEIDEQATPITNQILEANKLTETEEAISTIAYYLYLNWRIGKLEEWLPMLKGYKKLAQEIGRKAIKDAREKMI